MSGGGQRRIIGKRPAGLAVAAAVAAFIGWDPSAEAGVRLQFGYPYGPAYGGYYYYGQPYFAPGPGYYYYHPRRRPRAYAYQYEPDYYEPQPYAQEPDAEEPDGSARSYTPPPAKSKLPAVKTQSTRKLGGPVSCD